MEMETLHQYKDSVTWLVPLTDIELHTAMMIQPEESNEKQQGSVKFKKSTLE